MHLALVPLRHASWDMGTKECPCFKIVRHRRSNIRFARLLLDALEFGSPFVSRVAPVLSEMLPGPGAGVHNVSYPHAASQKRPLCHHGNR